MVHEAHLCIMQLWLAVTRNIVPLVIWISISGLPVHQPPVPHIFVPNFIHSLDASHMMLTALHAHRSGVTFCAVHDCFWTHAGTVEQMNDICRRQFLRLHSSGLLENLSEQCSKLAVIEDRVPPIPPRGTLDIERITESLYFFQWLCWLLLFDEIQRLHWSSINSRIRLMGVLLHFVYFIQVNWLETVIVIEPLVDSSKLLGQQCWLSYLFYLCWSCDGFLSLAICFIL